MTNGRGSRILPVLAAVLALAGIAVGLTVILIRPSETNQFEESLVSAGFALNDGNQAVVKRELLRASRYAVSAANWHQVLSIAASAIPEDAEQADYSLFSVLSGRASASLPGRTEFLACWAWGLMRSGDIEKALECTPGLEGDEWSALRAEIRIKAVVGSSDEDVEAFVSGLRTSPDPEFLESAAALTDSAELSLDAALLYMLSGRPDDAYGLALDIMDGRRRWNSAELPVRRGVAYAVAAIAQDAGHEDDALAWLQTRVDENRKRRASTWESLQMLGDLYWDRYLLRGTVDDRDAASGAWAAAMDLVRESGGPDGNPDGSWRLWVNQAVLMESAGRMRESRELLEEALVLFPDRQEVKASWSMEMKDEEPALARRLARNAYDETGDPLLGITSLRLDPESVTPRLYEARLWNLFDSVTEAAEEMHGTDARTVVSFLLDYMASRRNYSSIDVAIDRYRKVRPDDDWILSWRLAADAARRMAVIDLIAPVEGARSPYREFRDEAISDGSWRALHDCAMYSIMAADELSALRDRFPKDSGRAAPPADGEEERILLAIIEPELNGYHIASTPMGDRLTVLLRNRIDAEDFRKALGSGGRKGRRAAGQAAVVVDSAVKRLREEALESLELAVKNAEGLSGSETASLRYLEALALMKMGRHEESAQRARDAIAADPSNVRARELLEIEVTI